MGKLFVVGIGPGDLQDMTGRAHTALEEAELIVGYTVYTELLRPHFPEKTFYSTGMTGETARCRFCLEKAGAGLTVALVCSGDAGIYGMASLALELAEQENANADDRTVEKQDKTEIEIIPGVTAATSGGALLGAPLGHDFCVISLSDRLTDWNLIEKRLRCAAEGDFAICLYNPSSRSRKDCLVRACTVLLESRDPQTVCGIARNIGRAGESFRVMSLAELQRTETDMFTTVFIGSSQTRKSGVRMVTPRGYRTEAVPYRSVMETAECRMPTCWEAMKES